MAGTFLLILNCNNQGMSGNNPGHTLKILILRMVRERENLTRELRHLDYRTQSILTKLTNYSDEVLNLPPGPGVWSIMQVLTHVMMSERLSLQYVRKKLSFKPELKKSGLLAVCRLLLLKWAQYLPIRFRAPRGLQTEDLPVFSNLTELRTQWQTDRHKLHQFFAEADDSLFSKEVFRHQIVGRLSLIQMVSFFSIHLQRHVAQIEGRLP
jgi:hypothetical protein